jgi:hypothetical protein
MTLMGPHKEQCKSRNCHHITCAWDQWMVLRSKNITNLFQSSPPLSALSSVHPCYNQNIDTSSCVT